eukprot:8139822-Pyramimonas_sp.AAC.2
MRTLSARFCKRSPHPYLQPLTRHALAGIQGVFALVLLSCVCGTALSYVKLGLLEHLSATSYAMYAVVALLPAMLGAGISAGDA